MLSLRTAQDASSFLEHTRLSPPLARVIAADDGLRAVTRSLLWPVVWWAQVVLVSPALGALLASGAILGGMALSTGFAWLRRQRSRAMPAGVAS